MRNVIIIGGGIAGLAAAADLEGCRVTLLEAKARFGGRIHTVRTRGGNVELGAEFIHGQNESLLATVREAHLSTHDVSNRNRLFADARLEFVDIWETFSRLIECIDPREPDRSIRSFMESQNLDARTRETMLAFAEGFNAADSDKLSAHALRRAEYSAEQINGAKQMRIDEGYSALIDSLVDRARDRGTVLLNDVCVSRVSWRPGSVEVHALRNGAAESFAADAAIITLPLGVLKAHTVVFDPPLLHKEEAIAGLEFGQVLKITFVFREFWWKGADFGFIHALDEPIRTWWSNPNGPLIVGWTGGPGANPLLHDSAADLETVGLDTLARIFSTSAMTIRAQLASMHTHNWARDPHALGAYSSIPINGLFLPKLLGAPVEATLLRGRGNRPRWTNGNGLWCVGKRPARRL